MKFTKLIRSTALILIFTFVSSVSALAAVETNVWVEVELLQVQTGVYNGASDTRLLCTATNGAFENTWLIVDSTAASMVAAGALTAYSLGHSVVIKIVPYGTGYRVSNLRVVQP
nr:hypothetical protein [uncultured Desulfobulbus sp.]